MGKLVASLNGAIQGEFELNKERMTIGRKSDNDIHIDNLAVSGKHALVITILDDSFLEDLGSTNGTYVNGKLIKKHALRDGDVIGIGKHELRYVNEQASSRDEAFEKTMALRPAIVSPNAPSAPAPATTPTAPTPTNPAAARATSEATPPVLPAGRVTVTKGPLAGRSLELLKPVMTIGKPGVQVAVISRRPQGYLLTQVEGDGTAALRVNGQAVGGQAYTLKPGDVIEVAGVEMAFSYVA